MPTQPLRRRRPLRLPGWDYCQPAVYFVTLCTYHRDHLFDDPFSDIVARAWRAIPRNPPARHVVLDEWVVMPNHVHGLLILTDKTHDDSGERLEISEMPFPLATRYPGATTGKPSEARLIPGSLGAIVNSFKSVTTRRINGLRRTPGAPVWQRGYYERIVRNPRELEATRWYIRENPRRWAEDRENLTALLDRMNHAP